MSPTRFRGRACAAAMLLPLCLPMLAQARIIVVTKASDTLDGGCDSDCSLREAVVLANANSGPDLIFLRHPYYRLTRVPTASGGAADGDLDFTDDVEIHGLPGDGSQIDANGLDRAVNVAAGVTAELMDLRVAKGLARGRGGAIYNAGQLTLRRVNVNLNVVRRDGAGRVQGGGIYNAGVLRLNEVNLSSNIARDDETLTGGSGAGIYNDAGAQLYAYDTSFRYNRSGLDDATGYGAGLFNRGNARLDRCYFGRNDSGDGEGSAIANRDSGSVAVFNTTISGNGHDGSRGAVANGSLRITGERAPKANLLNVTIADNNGGGLLNTGRATLRNVVIGGNYTQDGNDRWYDAGSNCRNQGSGTMTQTYTVLGADGNCPSSVVTDNRRFFLEVLEPLRYLGGPTPVHPLRPGPYTIDAGDPLVCPDFDQRGGRRPADGDGNGSLVCDIGAMEVDADE